MATNFDKVKIKPITPAEVENKPIPDEIIAAFNDLIIKNYRSGEATVHQKEALKLARKNFDDAGKKVTSEQICEQIFDNGWMDVESTFMKAGWKVTYDKPAYHESYEAYFVFKK